MALPQQILVLMLASILSAGCAKSPTKSDLATEAQISILTSIDPIAEFVWSDERSFETSTLYSLLVAEIAGQRGLPEVTMHHYLQQASKTQDLGIIKQTVDMADYLNDDDSLLQATVLWALVEPDNPTPFSIATDKLIQQGRFREAKPLLKRTLELGGLDGIYTIHSLISLGNRMPPEDRQSYLALFDDLLQITPDNAYYLYAKASLLAHEGRYSEALETSQQAIQSDPKYSRAVLLEADLQDKLGHLDRALAHLQEHLGEIERRKYRNHKEFRLLYTRLLMKKHLFAEAEAQAEIVALKNRHDENILYYLGKLMLKYEHLDASAHYFSLLPDLTGLTGELRYYLGRISQLRGNQQQALEYFASVDDSRYLLSSFNEISKILDLAEDQPRLSTIFAEIRGKFPSYAPLL